MPDLKHTQSIHPPETLAKRIEEEILPLFERAIVDDAAVYRNPHLIECWEAKRCQKEDCPALHGPNLRCWQVAGTYCGGRIQGVFAEKYGNCRQCDVFRAACPTIVEELGENLNNLLYLLRKQREQTMEKARRIDHLNKELISSLENLDSKNREIQELVITDKLTGLYNRHYLSTVLEDEVQRCQRQGYATSLLMVDIDDFKSVNDTYGHLLGDRMLEGLGAAIKGVIRKYDRAFRYGGEEFVVLLPETDLTIAWMIAERIRVKFSERSFPVESVVVGSHEAVSRTVSIGCTCSGRGLTPEALIRQADEAMYAAKTQGKNQVVRFQPEE